jgi:ribosomal protein S18 acetylase RimI-like enzyme
MQSVRILQPGEEAVLDQFLAQRRESSLIMRSNLRAAGLEDRGLPNQATYAAAFEGGVIIGAAAHCWNGMVLVEAPRALTAVVQSAVERSGRAIAGLMGPWQQVTEGRRALGLAGVNAAVDAPDILYRLYLDQLQRPAMLSGKDVICRTGEQADRELLVKWRVEFSGEALGFEDSPELRSSCREHVDQFLATRNIWVLEVMGVPVASATINARLPHEVTVGGVWTPPEFRGRGYARAVVAGMLLAEREQGVEQAVLFADRTNPVSQRTYEALGFVAIGDYGIILFQEPQPVPRAG